MFTGDTLFLGGCGRFFEGSAEQMTEALVTIFTVGMVVRVVRGISFVVRVFLGLKLVVVVLGSLMPFRHVPKNDFY